MMRSEVCGLAAAAAVWLGVTAFPVLAASPAAQGDTPHRRTHQSAQRPPAGQAARSSRPVDAPSAAASKSIPMDFSGMGRSVQDVTSPSHAHGNVGFPGQGTTQAPGVVPSTTYRF